MKLTLLAGMAVYGLIAASPSLAPPNACRAVLKLTALGLDIYCPSVQCVGSNFECNENSDDADQIHWCACGVGGTVEAHCQAAWTDNPDGTMGSYACQNIACAAPTPSCKKSAPPGVVGATVYACDCFP